MGKAATRSLDCSGKAEVRDSRTVCCKQDVLWLQVEVGDPFGVGMGEALEK